MTKSEKNSRRLARRSLYAAVRAHLPLPLLLTQTEAQLRAHTRIIADQIIAGKNPHEVQVLP